MNKTEVQNILKKFKTWFKEELIESHKRNTLKLKDVEEFNINPFSASLSCKLSRRKF